MDLVINTYADRGIMKTLREWRAESLLGVKALAKKAGVSNTTIIQIERGEQVPLFRTIRRISEALEVDPKEIAEFAAAIQARSVVVGFPAGKLIAVA